MEIDGVEVRRLRLRKALSQRELGEAARVSAETVNEIEQGKRPRVFPRTLRALASVLGVEPGQLMGSELTSTEPCQ
jgi:transcriptional regulator with XRE-family HTH domain